MKITESKAWLVARCVILQEMDHGKYPGLCDTIKTMRNSNTIGSDTYSSMLKRLLGVYGAERAELLPTYLWPQTMDGAEQRVVACSLLAELPEYDTEYVDYQSALRGIGDWARSQEQRVAAERLREERRKEAEATFWREYRQGVREQQERERAARYQPVPVALRTADGLIAYTTVPAGLVQGPNYGGAKIERPVEYTVSIKASYSLHDTAVPFSRIYIHRGEQHAVEFTGSRIPLFTEELR